MPRDLVRQKKQEYVTYLPENGQVLALFVTELKIIRRLSKVGCVLRLREIKQS